MQEFKVGPEDVGKRTDVFVAEKYPQFARSALSILFDKKIVLINKVPAKAGDKLRKDEIVSLDESILFSEPPKVKLPIIYEDENVIVIDKPEGVLTHSKGSLNQEATVATFIYPILTDIKLVGNRAGIVHRLDRATSGVIITAKNTDALAHLQKQFSQRRTKKTYIAIVEGELEPKDAVIDAPIERNPKKPQTFRVGAGGKTAQTEYHTLKIFQKKGKTYSVLELKPVTGRTHQLRVHLAYIKHPIVGDSVYGKDDGKLYLHAKSLELTLPGGKRSTFNSPLPKKFKEFEK